MASVFDGVPALSHMDVGPGIDAYVQGRSQVRQDKAMDMQRAQEVSAIVTRGAQSADTPEKWGQFVGILQKRFPDADLSTFTDFATRQSMLDQGRDPYKDAALKIDQERLAMDKAKASAPSASPRPASPQEKAAFGVDPKTPLYIGPDGVPHVLSAGGVTVNNQGNIPAGYELVEDPTTGARRMQPIAGSPAAIAANTDAAKADANKAATDIGANVVVQDVDRLLKSVTGNSFFTTGLVAAATQGVPGTPAFDARSLVDTIKANSAFDKLQAMRNASPTGGALGNVSDTEGRLLAAAIGNLDLPQSGDQLADNLRRVKNIYLDIIHGPGNGPPRETLTFNKPGQGAPNPRAAPAPAGNAPSAQSGVIDFQTYFGRQ